MKCWKRRQRKNSNPYRYCPRVEAKTEILNQFSLDLLNKLPVDDNAVLSPLSISLALLLIHAGADEATRKQIEDAMMKSDKSERMEDHYKEILDKMLSALPDDMDLLIANRLFVRKDIQMKESYLNTIFEKYNATAENIETTDSEAAAEKINSFVADGTHDGITDIIEADSIPGMSALIVNATYFHSKWLTVFFPSNYTKEEKFYSSPNKHRLVQMMYLGKSSELYSSDDFFHTVSLKYTDPTFMFTIFLPKQRFGLEAAMRTFTGTDMYKLLRRAKYSCFEFYMPRMNISTDMDLSHLLKELGLKLMLETGSHLDGIAEGVTLSQVTHKSVIEVNEEGTTAYAATVGELRGAGLEPPPVITLDHPFLFTVTRDDNIIFMGKFV